MPTFSLTISSVDIEKQFRASGGKTPSHCKVCDLQKFDQNYGMKGSELRLGEEILLQEQFLRENAGAMVFYEPAIEVYHYVLPQKMSLSYRARRAMEAGAFRCHAGTLDLLFEVVRAFVNICVFPFRAIFRDRTAYPYWQNVAYEEVIPRVMPAVGAVLKRIKRRYR